MYSIEENKRIARQWIELVSAHQVEEICAMTAPTWTMRAGRSSVGAAGAGSNVN